MALIHLLLLQFILQIKGYDIIFSTSVEICNSSSYFDSLTHKCKSCGNFEKASDDHLSCECAFGYYPNYNEKSKTVTCVRCNDQTYADTCLASNNTCGLYDIKVLQTISNETNVHCLTCPMWHQPDSTRLKCIPCSDMCRCPNDFEDINGTCVPDSATIPDTPSLFTVNLYGKPYLSSYLQDSVRPSYAKCKVNGGGKFCERLANLCALTDYNYESQTTCSLYRQLSSGFGHSIYYDEGRNEYLINSAKINIFKDQMIEFVVKQYAADGTYQSIQPLESVFNSLCCSTSWNPIQRNINVHKTCLLYPKRLVKTDMRFYELYFVDRAFQSSNQSRLINVPLRILNFIRGGMLRNKDYDITRWQLTKRFFNFDVATGSNPSGNLDFVRYLSSLTIRISVVSDERTLGIRLPYATINYETIGAIEKSRPPTISFAVENVVSMDEAMKSLEIALCVLSAFAALYALLRIVVWYFRSDKTTIDLETLIRLLIYGADILGNVILTVVFLTTFYWFITFRQQEEVTVSLPGEKEEQFIKDLIISAFTLKAISVLWMIGEQCTVDIFFIDWESPRPTKGEVVSVWRMYFVANEWNELQVARKSSMSLQIILILLVLEVFGFERFALEIPSSYYLANTILKYHSVLRLALGSATYLLISLAQNIWNAVAYERYVEHKIQRFTDVCTLSNISVWLLVNARYGFYIHGRSPHGFADIDMATMCQQLQREEDNLCAQRGLVQGQDTQTFSMRPYQSLMEKWRKLAKAPAISQHNGTNGNTVFNPLNQFLTSFLDHALRDHEYEVRDRHFLETALDMELWTRKPVERTIFFNDGKNCFDSILFYGNETTLVTFELLLFSLVDLYCQSYLTAALVTFIIFKVLQFVRYHLGRRNLARKTKIDSRFLF